MSTAKVDDVAAPLPEAVREQTNRLNDIRRRWQAVLEAHRNNEVDVLNTDHHAQWEDIRYLLTALATAEADAQQERARLQEQIGRWEQCGLTLAKFLPSNVAVTSETLPDVLWKEIPVLIRSLRASHPPPTSEDR